MAFWRKTPLTVRPQSRVAIPLLLCTLMFGLTATVVYRLGYERWTPANPEPSHTATALVVERSASTGIDGLRIPIAYTDPDPARAKSVADALAEQYVHDRNADWQHRTEGPYLKAKADADSLRRNLAQDEASLETLRRQLTEQAATRQAAAPKKPSSTVENPAWSELNSQLQDLRRRRESLLADRTEQHPAVQEIQTRIDDKERQIAAVPRQLPGASKTNEDSKDAATDGAMPSRLTEHEQAQLDRLTAAVERSRETCQRAEGVEKQLMRLQQTGPQYTIEEAQVVEIAPEPDYSWQRLLATTLAAGALMALGVGSVGWGTTIEPSVATAADVRAATGVGVLGTIPAENPVPDVVERSRRQKRACRTLIACGLALIVACPLVAIWGVFGVY